MNDIGPNYSRNHYLRRLIFIIVLIITVFVASLFKGCSKADGLKDHSQPNGLKDYSQPLNKDYSQPLNADISSASKGVWTSYSESGNIIRESFYGVKVFKTIEYDTDGNITSIGEESIEFDEGIFGPNTVNNTFYKNGKIKCMEESSSGGALSYCFDENGKIIDNDGNLEEPSDRFKDLYFLSKNIRTHSPYF